VSRPRDLENERERRAQILAATYEALLETPWSALSLNAVAERAKLSKTLIAYYFGDKENLLTETMLWFLGAQAELVKQAVAAPASLATRIELLIAIALPERAELERQLRFQLEVWSFAKTSPEVTLGLQTAYRAFREACATMMEAARAEGLTEAGDPWLYLTLHALMDGLSFQLVLDPTLDLEVARARARAVVERLLGGL